MKIKKRMLTLCRLLFMLFAMWSCNHEIASELPDDNQLLSNNVIKSSVYSSTMYINFYNYRYNYKIGSWILETLEITMPEFIERHVNGGLGSVIGDRYSREEAEMQSYEPPGGAAAIDPSIGLNFELNVYINEKNEVFSPRIYLPDFKDCTNITLSNGSLVTDGDNGATSTEGDSGTSYTEETIIEGDFYYITNDAYMYFKIKPDSPTGHLGNISIKYRAKEQGPFHDLDSYYFFSFNYGVYVSINIIKGNPPASEPDAAEELEPAPKGVYEILVYPNGTILVYDSALESPRPDDGFGAQFYNSTYRRQNNGSISILGSSGKELAIYPYYYQIISVDSDGKRIDEDASPLPNEAEDRDFIREIIVDKNGHILEITSENPFVGRVFAEDTSYYVNDNGTVSIIGSDYKVIDKYPSSYRIIRRIWKDGQYTDIIIKEAS